VFLKEELSKLTENITENNSMEARIKELKNYLDNLQKMVFRNRYGN
jgi:hypothetical protein